MREAPAVCRYKASIGNVGVNDVKWLFDLTTRNVDTALSEVLVFKLFGAEAVTSIVTTPATIVVSIISQLLKRSPWIHSTFSEGKKLFTQALS